MLIEKIQELKKEIIEYAAHVEAMIAKSIRGLQTKDMAMLKEVIEVDEPIANEFELRMDKHCTTTIAQYQPTAGDLRTILMILKMGNDLERLGDEAVNISKSAIFLVERPKIRAKGVNVVKLADASIGMLKDSINSFINEDVDLAKNVCARDDIVDSYRDDTLKNLIAFIGEEPATVERSLHMMNICRKLERVADLSTNLCEDVIFMVEGKVIKHSKGLG
ncbi:phosphate signaling complex protein PhoU [bacterium]|nr:phosphate signaling complex protein PhoU [bacterium]MBU1063954.1 phosphate signaling complex protein PhoU [bacterium]MBU1635086.1 phosphate signaling complex protein PhoU [bacterium]MBU1872724.1 phosphate signaling complex protein PhoU [bacterium]